MKREGTSLRVRVQLSDNITFDSDVYMINGNEFLLYNNVTGFGWYSFLSMNGERPAITLVRDGENEA